MVSALCIWSIMITLSNEKFYIVRMQEKILLLEIYCCMDLACMITDVAYFHGLICAREELIHVCC